MSSALRIGSLFSGIDGLALGVQFATCGQVVWHSEIDKDACAVLGRHWRCPNLGDVSQVAWGGHMSVDVLVGGFPCQDISQAGKGAGIDGERSGLWREIVRCIRALGPGHVLVENVAAILVRGFSRVAADLAACGYRFAWSSYSSAAVGAPHRRDRVFILAAPDVSGERRQGPPKGAESAGRRFAGESVADGDSNGQPWLAASHGWRDARRDEHGERGDNAFGCGEAYANADRNPLREQSERSEQQPPERRHAEPLDNGRYPAAFGPAIRRWERVLGRVAPPMAITGARCGSVLNADFSEWMMGFPPGWTAGVSRTARLRLVGNAVQPQVAQAAFVGLLGRLANDAKAVAA